MTTEADPNFVRDWWQQILAAGGILWAIFRAEDSRRQVNRLLYDEHGSPRVVILADCARAKKDCQSDIAEAIAAIKDNQEKILSEIREEFQRHNTLHLKIAEDIGKLMNAKRM